MYCIEVETFLLLHILLFSSTHKQTHLKSRKTMTSPRHSTVILVFVAKSPPKPLSREIKRVRISTGSCSTWIKIFAKKICFVSNTYANMYLIRTHKINHGITYEYNIGDGRYLYIIHIILYVYRYTQKIDLFGSRENRYKKQAAHINDWMETVRNCGHEICIRFITHTHARGLRASVKKK